MCKGAATAAVATLKMGVRVLESQGRYGETWINYNLNWREKGAMKDFEMVLKEAGCKLVVIDFSATWCGPCQTIKPRFHELAEKNPSVIFCEVDVDDAPDLAEQCKINCMPTFHFYKNGERSVMLDGSSIDCSYHCYSAQLVFDFSGANRTTLEDKIRELQ